MNIARGLVNRMVPLSREIGKEVNFGVVNYSHSTIYCGTDNLSKVFSSDYHKTKHSLYSPQCEATLLDGRVFPLIKKDLKPGKTFYTFITDGEPCCIELEGCGCGGYEIYEGIEDACKSGIGSLYLEVREKPGILGKHLIELQKKYPNLAMERVSKIKDIKDKLESVLIRYD